MTYFKIHLNQISIFVDRYFDYSDVNECRINALLQLERVWKNHYLILKINVKVAGLMGFLKKTHNYLCFKQNTNNTNSYFVAKIKKKHHSIFKIKKKALFHI